MNLTLLVEHPELPEQEVFVQHGITLGPQLEEVLDSLIRESTSLVKAERGSMLLFDPKEGALRISASRGIPPEVVERVRIRPGEGFAGRAYAEGSPIFLSNLEPSPGGPGRTAPASGGALPGTRRPAPSPRARPTRRARP